MCLSSLTNRWNRKKWTIEHWLFKDGSLKADSVVFLHRLPRSFSRTSFQIWSHLRVSNPTHHPHHRLLEYELINLILCWVWGLTEVPRVRWWGGPGARPVCSVMFTEQSAVSMQQSKQQRLSTGVRFGLFKAKSAKWQMTALSVADTPLIMTIWVLIWKAKVRCVMKIFSPKTHRADSYYKHTAVRTVRHFHWEQLIPLIQVNFFTRNKILVKMIVMLTWMYTFAKILDCRTEESGAYWDMVLLL